MPMEMDTSLDDDSSPTDVNQLVKKARGKGGIDVGAGWGGSLSSLGDDRTPPPRSTSTRPTFARDNSSIVTRGNGRFPDNTATSFSNMQPGDRMAGPDELNLAPLPGMPGQAPQGAPVPGNGADMAGAYQKLLHSVAMQHGGAPPQSDDPYAGKPEGYNPLSDSQPGQKQTDPTQPGGFHEAAFKQLLHSVAMQHGGTPPQSDDAPPGGGPAPPASGERAGSSDRPSGGSAPLRVQGMEPGPAVYRGGKQGPEGRQEPPSDGSLPPPPKLPAEGASKEALDRYHAQHTAWEDERQFIVAKSAIEARGPSKDKLAFAAVSAEHKAATQDLRAAQDKLKVAKTQWFNSGATAAIQKEVDTAQKLVDDVAGRRSAITRKALGSGNDTGEGTRESPIILKSDGDATPNMLGKIVSVNGKLHRVAADSDKEE